MQFLSVREILMTAPLTHSPVWPLLLWWQKLHNVTCPAVISCLIFCVSRVSNGKGQNDPQAGPTLDATTNIFACSRHWQARATLQKHNMSLKLTVITPENLNCSKRAVQNSQEKKQDVARIGKSIQLKLPSIPFTHENKIPAFVLHMCTCISSYIHQWTKLPLETKPNVKPTIAVLRQWLFIMSMNAYHLRRTLDSPTPVTELGLRLVIWGVRLAS